MPPAGIHLDTDVALVPGVGRTRAGRLEKLGISTVRDLLMRLPRRIEDTSAVHPLSTLRPGPDPQTVRARVIKVDIRYAQHTRMAIVEATLEQDGAIASAVWFNQPFLRNQLQPGMELLLSGKAEYSRSGLTLKSPKFEQVSGGQHHVGTLAPVYPETEGLTSKFLRPVIESLMPLAHEIPDPLPPAVRVQHGVPALGDALAQVHFPADMEQHDRARRRIAFEELFLLQLAATRARRRRLTGDGIAISYDVDVARRFARSLPFALTTGQRIAAHEVLTDMAGNGPMNRLLQGDVGSGKTAVAAMAVLMAHAAGHQSVVMAPTEILARQHHVTLERLLEPHGLSPRLLVGSTPTRARREILAGAAGGHDALLVGTHALIEDDVVLADLGLIVVDEQHRFGVVQRQRMRRKARRLPNFLAMTATPIPRSLALTLYGDVNVSELREMPPGRTPVQTRMVPPTERDGAYAFVHEHVTRGRQAFVICPLIEESDKLGVRSATAEYERLRTEVFPDLRVELLHGRMKPADKERRMQRFTTGEADILVSTSVVEVGVDVPNATIMLIEGAERFGLAQLHQFRGRVGRGAHESFCLLFAGAPDDGAARRLDLVASTPSGFDLAEYDLRQRGAGDVAGLRQHGLPELRVADLLDHGLMLAARTAAEQWLDNDPGLTGYAPLSDAMNGYRAVFDLD